MERPKNLKRIVAECALCFVDSGMILGIGSGTTVREFIKVLAEKKMDVVGVPTSMDTEMFMIQNRIKVMSPYEVDRIDLAVDGADSILLERNVVLKGGGGALAREKVVDYFAKKFLIIVDESKINRMVPIAVEIIPFSLFFVRKELEKYGQPYLRLSNKKLGPVITDNGNWLIDLRISMDKIDQKLEYDIKSIPGVVENGIFSREALILVSKKNGSVEEYKLK
ncbi:MAG: ribose 5-phosphate isomerase A [Candidatus Njordarchaeota archaeon]